MGYLKMCLPSAFYTVLRLTLWTDIEPTLFVKCLPRSLQSMQPYTPLRNPSRLPSPPERCRWHPCHCLCNALMYHCYVLMYHSPAAFYAIFDCPKDIRSDAYAHSFYSSSSMSTTLNRSALQLDIDITPYFSGRHQVLMMHEGTDGFEEAVRAMADECNLHLYRGILYNMPYKIDFPPPYYYVLQGYYIGVFTSYIWCVY
jgi:hypothetical protein